MHQFDLQLRLIVAPGSGNSLTGGFYNTNGMISPCDGADRVVPRDTGPGIAIARVTWVAGVVGRRVRGGIGVRKINRIGIGTRIGDRYFFGAGRKGQQDSGEND